MDLFEREFDLSQMKEYFEKQISGIRIISDLNLSENDFKKLSTRLTTAFSEAESKIVIEDFGICYLVYWVYALIYWDEEAGIHDELMDYCQKLPQYQIRYHLHALVDTFADYGLYDFGYQFDNVEELCSVLIARHAGIPNDEKQFVFDLIDDYRKYDLTIDAMVADIHARLPYKSQYIFSLMDYESRKDVVWEIRTLMAKISSKVYTRSDIRNQYPHLSGQLIVFCYEWLEQKKRLQL